MTQGFSGTHFSRLLTDMSSYNNDKGSSWPHVWDNWGQSIQKPKSTIFAKMQNSVFSLEDSMYKPGNMCQKGIRWHNSSWTIVLWNCKTWALNVLLSRRWSSFLKKVTLWPFSVELPFGAFSRVVWAVVSLKSREIFSNGLFLCIIGGPNRSKSKIRSPGTSYLGHDSGPCTPKNGFLKIVLRFFPKTLNLRGQGGSVWLGWRARSDW